jgi:hypothetical protein
MRTMKEEEIDLSEYEIYADAVRQVERFLDEVYMRQQYPFFLGVSHSSRVCKPLAE